MTVVSLRAERIDPVPSSGVVMLPHYTGGRIQTIGENIAKIGMGLSGGQTTQAAIDAARTRLKNYRRELDELEAFLP